ncbi:MAG: type II toxin-antitoxin system RelE/ParE family toxin [Fibrobacter sp.]|nr:type II toxin-antitoxin system RelE/ParE family toxin [Fibrobacter sp.]
MFKITFYQTVEGVKPAVEFLDGLDVRAVEKVRRGLELLRLFGNSLREPNSKKINKDLFELRVIENSNIYRMFYFFVVGNEIIITHGFTKKSTKTPENEIKRAEAYREDYLKRH